VAKHRDTSNADAEKAAEAARLAEREQHDREAGGGPMGTRRDTPHHPDGWFGANRSPND
jgi:hypothetical protein